MIVQLFSICESKLINLFFCKIIQQKCMLYTVFVSFFLLKLYNEEKYFIEKPVCGFHKRIIKASLING